MENYIETAIEESKGSAITEERIHELAGDSKIRINKVFRAIDQSHLYPVSGNFNATERSIRRVQRFQNRSGIAQEGYEYICFVCNETSIIVKEVCK